MATVRKSITIENSADAVWDTVRDFGRIDRYVAAVEAVDTDGRGTGMTRTLTLQDGAQVTERLETRNDDARVLRYTITEAPLPVENYVSMMAVRGTGPQQCEVDWACTFDPVGASGEEAADAFEALYAAGLEGLNTLHGT